MHLAMVKSAMESHHRFVSQAKQAFAADASTFKLQRFPAFIEAIVAKLQTQASHERGTFVWREQSTAELVHAAANEVTDWREACAAERVTIREKMLQVEPMKAKTLELLRNASESVLTTEELEHAVANADPRVAALVASLQACAIGSRTPVASGIASLANAPPAQSTDPMRGALAAAGALPPLVAMLGDGTAEERAAAAEALGKLAHNKTNKAAMTAVGAVEALMALVRDGDAQGKANAAGALWTLASGNAAIEAAMEAIIDALRVGLKSIHEQVKQIGGVDKVEELMDEWEDFNFDRDELQHSIDAELAHAKKYVEASADNAAAEAAKAVAKDMVLNCLREKKMYEQQLMTLGTKNMKLKIHIENLKLTVESMKMNAEIIDALRVAWTMQEQVKQMGGVDNVEELVANDLSNVDLGDVRTMTSSSSSSMGSWRRSWWPICLRSTRAARSSKVRDGDAQGKANAAAVSGSQVKKKIISVEQLERMDAVEELMDAVEDAQTKKIISEEQLEELMDAVEDAQTDVREIEVAMNRQMNVPGLAWSPWSPTDAQFSARFSATHRTYKYFFARAGLDVERMAEGARRLLGEHDFRNFCKIDPSVTNFRRSVLAAAIQPASGSGGGEHTDSPLALWEFEVRGTAFLYHQVRCMVAVLFLIGEGKEAPTIVSELLDTARYPRRPNYEIASEAPLLLYEVGYEDLVWRTSPAALDEVHSLWGGQLQEQSLRFAMLRTMHASLEVAHEGPCAAEFEEPARKRGRGAASHVPLAMRPTAESVEHRTVGCADGRAGD
jgi:tRNA pseudouridine(38-40) synthase